MQEGEPLEHEVAAARDAQLVRAPMLEAIAGEAPEDLEALVSGDVPVSPLLDLSEEPRLHQRPAREHHLVRIKVRVRVRARARARVRARVRVRVRVRVRRPAREHHRSHAALQRLIDVLV